MAALLPKRSGYIDGLEQGMELRARDDPGEHFASNAAQ